MAQRLIVGIFPDNDGAAIESALTSAKVDPTQATVVRKASGVDDDPDYDLQFVDVVLEEEVNSFSDDMTNGSVLSITAVHGSRVFTLGIVGAASVPHERVRSLILAAVNH